MSFSLRNLSALNMRVSSQYNSFLNENMDNDSS